MTPPLVSEATAQLLQLSFLPGVGTSALRRLASRAKAHGLSALQDPHAIAREFARGVPSQSKQNGRGWMELLENCTRHDIRLISALDYEFSRPLALIDDYPPILYVRGDVTSLAKISCAVVGTREASRLGLSWAKQIAEIFASRGYCVVSGLALGIDTSGHEGALRAQGQTVAVLAHGLDQITPSSNRPLAERILSSNGALVSEHPPGVPPRKPEYVRRNRIQSGLSMCSVVVESGEVGGAIHQGNFTHRQGRKLFCVVPDRAVPGAAEFRYGGADRLIKELAAKPFRSRDDLLGLIESKELEMDYARFCKAPEENRNLLL